MAESRFLMQLSSSLRRISYLAMLVSLSVGVLPPAVFFALEYRYQDAAIRTEVQINARLVSDLVNRNPELWQFEQLRLEELLGNRPKDGNSIKEIREIFNISGHSVARSADALSHPVVRARSPVFNAGRVVGAMEVTRSLRHWRLRWSACCWAQQSISA